MGSLFDDGFVLYITREKLFALRVKGGKILGKQVRIDLTDKALTKTRLRALLDRIKDRITGGDLG